MRRGICGGGIPGLGIRADAGAADAEVEEDGGGHDRNDAVAECEADVPLHQVTDGTGCGVESERTAAGEDDAVYVLNQVPGAQQLRLASAGRRTAHVDTGGGRRIRQHHGAARDRVDVGPVTDADAGNVRDGTVAHRSECTWLSALPRVRCAGMIARTARLPGTSSGRRRSYSRRRASWR